ncbi:hypothetical protein, partial [Geobacillus thermoleovorans]|uniref:hypothetical protein n=1 Tax=Geobacillus thermoleovorans TaxID=33941 RepID=UPI003DA6AE25
MFDAKRTQPFCAAAELQGIKKMACQFRTFAFLVKGIENETAEEKRFFQGISPFPVMRVGGGSNVFYHRRFIATVEFRAVDA